MNPFEILLEELGRLIGIALHADKGYLCKLSIQGLLTVQIEHEPSFGRILIASFLCEIPAGKFREDTLKEALKANGSLDRAGIFAYSGKNNSLAYFTYLPETAPANEVHEALLGFIEKAKTWKSAVETGRLHLVATSTGARVPFT